MSTHNLCFGAKIRKIGIPLYTPVLLYKSGVQRDIHYMDIVAKAISCHYRPGSCKVCARELLCLLTEPRLISQYSTVSDLYSWTPGS